MQTDGYSQILSLFSENREEQFSHLRLKLVRFFELQGAIGHAEDFADETISRVAEKLAAGVKIETGEPYYYFRGVAVNILREHWRRKERLVSLDDVENINSISAGANPAELREKSEDANLNDRRLDCLSKTLKSLPAENRELFLKYHHDSKGSREHWRAQIAQSLRIDVTALRNRVTRLRKKIEQLVLECLDI